MPPDRHEARTRASATGVGKLQASPTNYSKDFEAAVDAHIRAPKSGLTFDSVGLRIGIDGETLRRMLDPGDRLQLGSSRVMPLLRALGTSEPFNAYARLDGHQVGGVMQQLLPTAVRASTRDLQRDIGGAARELGEIVEAVADALSDDGRINALEATGLLSLLGPHVERLHGVIAQLETLERREDR